MAVCRHGRCLIVDFLSGDFNVEIFIVEKIYTYSCNVVIENGSVVVDECSKCVQVETAVVFLLMVFLLALVFVVRLGKVRPSDLQLG